MNTPAAIDALIARIAEVEIDPAEVRVVIEARHGMLGGMAEERPTRPASPPGFLVPASLTGFVLGVLFLVAGDAVDTFPEQVRVTVVAGVFLDHV